MYVLTGIYLAFFTQIRVFQFLPGSSKNLLKDQAKILHNLVRNKILRASPPATSSPMLTLVTADPTKRKKNQPKKPTQNVLHSWRPPTSLHSHDFLMDYKSVQEMLISVHIIEIKLPILDSILRGTLKFGKMIHM